MKESTVLVQLVQAAVAGDRFAAEELLCAVQDDVYRLSLRMLGHPQDAEDAAQEILLVILTHLGSFRGESSFRTWSWRIASNHLVRARRGRLERVTFESLSELLGREPEADAPAPPEAELRLLALEVRLRCTEAMLLALDRNLRLAFVLGEIFALSGDEAAAILEVDAATYRKRLSRARTRLLGFLRAQCGVFDPENPCRCEKQVGPALGRGQLVPGELLLASHPRRSGGPEIERCATEVDRLLRAFAVGAPTDVVREVGGADPETFETIVRRYVRGSPLVRRTLRGRTRALGGILRAILTRGSSIEAISMRLELPRFPGARLALDSPRWRSTHAPESPRPAPAAPEAARPQQTTAEIASTPSLST